MIVNPADFIAEILGKPSREMQSSMAVSNLCPYVTGPCTKTAKRLPFPVCSVYKGAGRGVERSKGTPVCVCPKRLFQADLVKDIVDALWDDYSRHNLACAYEVQLKDLGNIDMVIVDRNENHIRKFISVELQAVDITGSCYDAYKALSQNNMLPERPKYGFNWKNVFKRYVMQLIHKGKAHYDWGTKIVAVMQDELVERIWSYGEIRGGTALHQSDIVFFSYAMESQGDGGYSLRLKEIKPTTHMSLMQGILYKKMPPKDEILSKIMERIVPL